MLEIGRQFFSKAEHWFIVVPPEETKTGTYIEFSLPEILIPYLRHYLEVIRPGLQRGRNGAALWISTRGGAFSYVGLVQAYARFSARLGIRIAPHDARDAAATTWAIWSPDQIGIARDLLAHRDLRTIKHYNRARGIEASRAYGRVISEIRKNHKMTS